MPEKILVIDDDYDIFEAIAMIFQSHGYQVVTAGNGIEGLALLKAEKPDLIILDLLMPKMDGFTFLKELREPNWSEFREIPILILTSVREEASRRRYHLETGQELGVDDYIEKPIAPDTLLRKVNKLLKRKQKV